jgi:hypothetical protein
MLDALIMRSENTVIFLWPPDGPSHWRLDPEAAPPGWEVRQDVVLDAIAPDMDDWPPGADSPEAVLCVSKEDEKHFHVYKYRREIDRLNFRETGWNLGGIYAASEPFWERLLKHHAEMEARLAEPDDDPPGAMDEVLESIRRGR